MTNHDVEGLLFLLRMPTNNKIPLTEGNYRSTIEIGMREIREECINLQFFYSDMSSLCIKLNVDDTWNYTVGQ